MNWQNRLWIRFCLGNHNTYVKSKRSCSTYDNLHFWLHNVVKLFLMENSHFFKEISDYWSISCPKKLLLFNFQLYFVKKCVRLPKTGQSFKLYNVVAQPIKQFAQANSSLIILVFWTTYRCVHENRSSTLERISPPCEKFQTQHTSTLNSRVCKKVRPSK